VAVEVRGAASIPVAAVTPASVVATVALLDTLQLHHRRAIAVAAVFNDQLDGIAAGQLVDIECLVMALRYLTGPFGQAHHALEERLFSLAGSTGDLAVEPGALLAVAHRQLREQGHQLRANVGDWRAGRAGGETVVGPGRDYITGLYRHLHAEEIDLLPRLLGLPGAALTPDLLAEAARLTAADPIFGTSVARDYRRLAQALRRAARGMSARPLPGEWVGLDAAVESLDVLALALRAGRTTTRLHIRTALQTSLAAFRDDPLRAPLRTLRSNSRQYLGWLRDVALLGRDAAQDLLEVNDRRRARRRLLRR